MSTIPSYLHGYEGLYENDPRAAALAWFREAKYGLFLHYGLYSLLGRHEWVQLKEKISVAEMETWADKFTAEKFDADAIVDLACAAGMKYINLTTRHHDGFCLFASAETGFSSVNAPAQRDLVAELAAACAKRGIGFFLYYSHGRDWRHPHAPNNDEWGGYARPEYDPPESVYATGETHNLQHYLDFMTAQITELLTNYGRIAGIWLDGIATPLSGDWKKFRCQELYDHIHSLQPQVLVSYKQGLLGTEDFFAPEHKAVERDADKPMEICTTMISAPVSWGDNKGAVHKKAETVRAEICAAKKAGCNLLLNTGPLADGSIHAGDEAVLREVGAELRTSEQSASHA